MVEDQEYLVPEDVQLWLDSLPRGRIRRSNHCAGCGRFQANDPMVVSCYCGYGYARPKRPVR